ncbi:hypothetical protein SAMN05216360_11041 [Methylobacterium phyllostachyos]|uniref:Uncharacterized protein n=1 Tax=Methylobacterium phyllostachyos TaxID=582672 RepID=A0A1H0D6W5_9HYPH|nr:hypothetical protein SAMN05216360_11041 [Methylobacterium phyllostachyos]
MFAATKIAWKADRELVLVFGGWIAFEITILFACMISMS